MTRAAAGAPARSRQPLRLTAAAGLATALTTTALAPVFGDRGWWLSALGAVAAVTVAGLLSREYRWRPGAQLLLAVALLADYLCVVFVRPTLVGGVLPGAQTWTALHALLDQGVADIQVLTLPVPTHPGLVFVTCLGTGGIALLVDVAAVTVGRAVLAGVGLLVLFAVPGAVQARGIGWFPFALAAGGWLLLLHVEGQGRRRRWGRPVGPAPSGRADPGSARVGRRIGTAALGISVVVPTLLPGFDSRLLTGRGSGLDGPQTTTTYNPITRLRADLRLPTPRPILRYRTTDPQPDYLRMTTLDRFSDSGWTSSRLSGTTRRNGVSGPLPDPIGLTTAATVPVTVRVQVQGLQARWLPVPVPPREVSVPGPWLYDARSETVFGIRTDTHDLTGPYTATASRVLVRRATLAAVGNTRPAALPASLRAYVAPPVMTAAVAALTDRVVRGARTDYDRVAALQAFFLDASSGFVYDTSPTVPGLNGPSALEDFLTRRRGFCEQYASAMAAMVRRAGVPARVAVGFTRGTRLADGSFAVTTADAHAWPEAWFAGSGWVRFEPTPRADGQTTVPDYAGDGEQTAASPSSAPSSTAPSTAPSSGPSAGDNTAQLEAEGAGSAASRSSSSRTGWLLALLMLVGGVALGAVPALLGALRRRLRRRGGPLAAGAAWRQLQDDAYDVGLAWSPAASPRAVGALVVSAVGTGGAAAAAGRLVDAVEQARYARPGDRSGPDLRSDSAAVRAGLLSSVSRARRLRAVVLAPSTVRWAYHAVGTAVADGLDALDNGWAALRRSRSA